MFDWNDHDQVEDTIWAEFNESEDHTVPYLKGVDASTPGNIGDQKRKNHGTASIVGLTECTSGAQANFPGLEKQYAVKTNGQHSAIQFGTESWPELPLNVAVGRTYNNDSDQDNMASTYLDFNPASGLEKVGGNTEVQLDDGEPEFFGNDHEESSNSFLECDWGNLGGFGDDSDRLFSNSDSIFCSEMVANGDDFLSPSSDVISSTVQSIPIPLQQSSYHGSSLLHINEPSGGSTKQDNMVADAKDESGEQAECKKHLPSEYSGKPSQFLKEVGDVQKRLVRLHRKPGGKHKGSNNISGFSKDQAQHPPSNVRTLVNAFVQSIELPAQHMLFGDGKNMGQIVHANQFVFTGCGYPTYPFPTIHLMPNFQAEGHQTQPAAAHYRTLTDSSKRSGSSENPQDVLPSRQLMMTPQEKIEKLRHRQQMQAMLAIQQQQEQFGHQVPGSDTSVPQAYSPRNKNPDSFSNSIVLDQAANKVFSQEMNILTVRKELERGSAIPDDLFMEEKIYHQLQNAVRKLDARIRLCIRDSLLRLARSATERQVASDRSSTDKRCEDEDEISETETPNRIKRSSTAEAETDTNPIDRIVAHLLFHRHGSKLLIPAKEEMSSTPLSTDPGTSED